MLRSIFFCLLVCGGCGGRRWKIQPCSADYFAANQTSYVNVVLPRSLHRNDTITGGIPHQRAHFGRWYTHPHEFDGRRMVLPVLVVSSDLCQRQHQQRSMIGIQNNNRNHDNDLLAQQGDSPTPFLALVNRSEECSFVTQTRNAQQVLGASGVIIANHLCLCSDQTCLDDGPNCETKEPIMAATDTDASDISIPSILLPKMEAKDIFLALSSPPSSSKQQQAQEINPASSSFVSSPSQPSIRDGEGVVVMELAFRVPRVRNVTVEYWYAPYSESSSISSLIPLSNISNLMQGDAAIDFRPRYLLLNGTQFNCGKNGTCPNMCTNGGRYCAVPPSRTSSDHNENDNDNDAYHSISGQEIVIETLRRMCLWKYLTESKEKGSWWTYVTAMETCRQSDNKKDEDDKECVKVGLKRAKISNNGQEALDRCMLDSGDIYQNVPNSFLEAVLEDQRNHGIHHSTLIVNHAPMPFHAGEDGITVARFLQRLCRSYESGFVPDVCRVCLASTCSDPGTCATQVAPTRCHRSSNNKKEKRHHRHGLFWFFVWCLILAPVGYWYYAKRIRGEDWVFAPTSTTMDGSYTVLETSFGD